MIAFAGMLISVAKSAGIYVPPNPDNYNPQEYKYWHVFCNAQIGSSMPSPLFHCRNAKIVASIPEDKITTITCEQLLGMGFEVGRSGMSA